MNLTPREKLVLGEVIRQYIQSATPVSSSSIAKHSYLGMSPATIRNILAQLEMKGYIYQPHPSAGRIPNTLGYRVYVNDLMKRARLNAQERNAIRETLLHAGSDLEEVMREVSRILAHLARQLGIILSPRIEKGIFERMEIVPISSERVLIVISIQSGLVKTIVLEINTLISRERLVMVNQILNERLSGMTIAEIRRKFSDIVKDIRNEESGLVQLILNSSHRIFDFDEQIEMYYMGTQYMVKQPDFSDIERVSSVVEVLEEPQVMVHLLEEDENENVSIKIGDEITEERMKECSIISARYKVGTVSGALGIIGPTRMNYSKLVVLVEYTARTVTEMLNKN